MIIRKYIRTLKITKTAKYSIIRILLCVFELHCICNLKNIGAIRIPKNKI